MPASAPAASLHPRSGLYIVAGMVASLLFSAVAGSILIEVGGWDTTSPTGTGAYLGRAGAQTQVLGVDATPLGLPIWALAVAQVPLWIGLVGGVWFAGDRSFARVRRRFGLSVRPSDVPIGAAIGAGTQLVLVPLLYVPILWLLGDRDVSEPARALTDRAGSVAGVVLLVIGVGLVAPVVEELFFRGLVLRTFERRMPAVVALIASGLVFGLIHLQPLQFPALVLFGLVAGVLVQRSGRLGLAIGAHVGFNVVTLAILLTGG